MNEKNHSWLAIRRIFALSHTCTFVVLKFAVHYFLRFLGKHLKPFFSFQEERTLDFVSLSASLKDIFWLFRVGQSLSFPNFTTLGAGYLRWVPEAFHARFPVSVKSLKWLRPKTCRPAADESSSALHRTREKTSGTQGTGYPHFFVVWLVGRIF